MSALRFVITSVVAVFLTGFAVSACSVVNAPEDAIEPSSTSSTGTGGQGTGGDDCDSDAPTVTSEAVQSFQGDSAVYALTFSESVDIEAGAISIDNGATVDVTPTLPGSGMNFTVALSGLNAGTPYTLTISASGVADACGNSLASDFTVAVSDDCDADTTPPSLVTTQTDFTDGSMTGTFTLEFTEPTELAMGAITATGMATVNSVTPPLPATSTTFSVTVGNLIDSTRLVVLPGSVQDVCGNSPAMAQELLLCSDAGGTVTFDTPGNHQFEIPACAGNTVQIVAAGAQGGTAGGTATGGLGGMAMGLLTVSPAEVLEVNVGGAGAGMTGMNCNEPGGDNGGGNTGNMCCSFAGTGAGSGGGASDVRQFGTALTNRVIVAGGGGGAGSFESGGDGGGLTGANGVGSGSFTAATGGTQTAGGLPGGTATGTCNPATPGGLGVGGIGDGNDGGGGGGGLWGGGGGANNGSGGGGSSFIGGVMNGMTTPGMNTGNGSVTISWM